MNANASGISYTPAVGPALLAHAGSRLADTVHHYPAWRHSPYGLVKAKDCNPAKQRAWTSEGAKERWEKMKGKAQEDKRKCELVQSLPKLERRQQELQAAAEKKERAAKPFLVFAHRAGDEGPRNGRAFSAAWHRACLFPKNPLCPMPCFRSRIHPVHSRGVVIKDIDGLKSAIRPFGLNQPLITVTQYDVKKRSSRGRPHFDNVAGICDGQRARLWNLVEKRSP